MSLWGSTKAVFERALAREEHPRIVVPIRREAAGGVGNNILPPGQCYVRVNLARMQLRYSGQLWRDFYPLAQSSIELSRENADRITVPCVIDPAKISNFPTDNGQAIQASNIDLLSPTPYIGGGINVALGLSAAVAQDYLQNLLAVLSSLSSMVGGTTLTSALTMIGPLKSGAESLLEMGGDVTVKVGALNGFAQPPIDAVNDPTSLSWLRDGYFAIVNIDESSNVGPWLRFENNKLLVDTTDGPREIVQDHIVFQISQQPTMDDWSRVPGLYEAKNRLVTTAVSKGIEADDYRQQLIAFKLSMLGNVDVVESQRFQIIASIKNFCEQAAGGNAPVNLLGPEDPAANLASLVGAAPQLDDAHSIVANIR